jgi:iron(III) transport system permease protein
MRGRRSGGRGVVSALAVVVAVVSLLPIAYLFLAGISFGDIARQFRYPTTLTDILTTIGLTLAISLVCMVLGLGAALLVVRTDLPFRRLLTVLFAMPLAIPGFVSSYAIYSASLVYAPRSEIVTTFLGATLIMSLSLYPYVFLACIVAVSNIDPAQEEAARSLNSRPFAVLWRVVIPQLRPALAGGVLIVGLHVLSEYGAMVQLRQHTLTTTIMGEMLDYGDYGSARSLSLLLTGLAVVMLLATRALTGRSHVLSVGRGAVRPPAKTRLGRARVPVFVIALIIPLAALGPTVVMTMRGLTTPRINAANSWMQVLQATASTLNFAAWTAIVATLVALPVSWWISRRPSMPAQLTERAVWLAHSVPNAILALALVFLATRLIPDLYKTSALLIAAYVILYLPLAVANQRVGLQAAFVSYDEAAASLGSRVWRRLTRISLPLALPGLATGALLVGLDASKELTTTLMLLPFNSKTLATGLWSTTNGESLDFSAAAPYTLMLVILGSLPVYLIVRRTLRAVT